jgi:DNA-binding LytR/AlgR family response regulator
MIRKHLSAIIIDDEPHSAGIIENYAHGNQNLMIEGSFTDPSKALQFCIKSRPDIVFLDILMPGYDGFSVLKQLHAHRLNPYIVFITEHDNYAIKAIKAGAFDYLLKSFNREEFDQTISRILNHFLKNNVEHRLDMLEQFVLNHRKLSFNTRSGLLLINPDDILYIEADSNYSDIHYNKKKREVVSVNIGAIECILPEQFIRISRSIIINSNYLVKISGANKRCYLIKEKEEFEFTIPEKHVTELRRILCPSNSNH